MPIDTGDLSDNTYNAIMIEAEKFNHDLTLQFGLLSYDCEDEKDFITKSKLLIRQMLKYNSVDIDDLFFGNPPSKKELHQVLQKILSNIQKL